jgi:hypothetical protein
LELVLGFRRGGGSFRLERGAEVPFGESGCIAEAREGGVDVVEELVAVFFESGAQRSKTQR